MKIIKAKTVSGDECLSSIAVITLLLDNGRRVSLNVAAEIQPPAGASDAIALSRWALRLPSKLAFWRHQERRALAQVRTQERDVKKLRARMDLTYRGMVNTTTDRDSSEFGLISAYVDNDKNVDAAERKLNTLRHAYERVKTVADAVEHQCFIVPRLLHGVQAFVKDRA